jgi:hypothetical protein
LHDDSPGLIDVEKIAIVIIKDLFSFDLFLVDFPISCFQDYAGINPVAFLYVFFSSFASSKILVLISFLEKKKTIF